MHPSPEDLLSFLQATLSAEESEQVATHVEQCPGCEATLLALEADSNTLVEALRHGATNPDSYAEESGCDRLVERIQAIGREPSFSVPSQREILPGASVPQQIGPYQLLAKLGEGGMGAVYKALHTRLKKVVALKVLPVGRTQDEHALERFEREMEAVGRVEHPNIVRAMDAGEHQGTHFLVMEYVDGLDFSAVVRAVGPLPIADACEAIRQAAIGLEHAHEHGLVHRDIKPGNLMLSTQGQVKILDLGLARLGGTLAPDRRELTNTGQVMGTLDYMAPEQGGDSREVDIRADVYSLGASLYRLLTGEPPFYGPKYESPIQKLTALAIEPVPAIRTRRSEVSEQLAVVVHRMLAKNPADRYSAPGDVAAALAPFVGGADLARLARQADDAQHAKTSDLQLPATVSTDHHLSAHHTDTTRNRAVAPTPQASGNTSSSLWRRIPAPLVATAAGMAFVLFAATIWLVIRDKDGKEKARIAINASDNVEVAEGADKPSDKDSSSKGDNNNTPVGGNVPIKLAPLPALAGGEPLSAISLVPRPAKLDGVRSWTLETIGHRDAIGALSFQPQGELLASVSEDRTIRIWDVKSGKLVHAFVGAPRTGSHFVGGGPSAAHNGSHFEGTNFLMHLLAWSPDGRLLAYCSKLGDLAVWDVPSGRRVHSESGEIGWMIAAWSPDGKQLALGGLDAGIRVKDSTTWREVFAVRERLAVHLHALAWSPDSNRLIIPNEHDNRLSLINVAEPIERQEIKLPEARVLGLCWAPADVIGVTTTKGVFVVAPDTGEPRQISEGIYPEIQSSRDGQQLLAGVREVALIDRKAVRAKETLGTDDKAPIYCPTWSSDGQYVASTTQNHGVEPVDIKIYLRDQQQLLASKLIRGNERSQGVAWSSDGRQLFAGVSRASRYFSSWDLAFNKPTWPRAIEIGSTGSGFAPTTRDGAVVFALNKFLNARTGSRVGEIAGLVNVYDAHWSPDEKILALAAEDSLLLYDGEGKNRLRQFEKCFKVGEFACVRWALDGQRVAVSADYCEHVAVVRSDGEGEPLQIPGKGWNLVWLDAQRLAIGRETGWVDVWDVEANEKVLAVKGSPAHGAGPVQWLEKAQQLVTAGYDRKLRFWDREGELIREIPLPDGGDVFSPDLRYLAGTGCTNAVRLWDLASGQPQGTIVMLRDGYHAIVSPDGHIKASPEIKNEFIYVVEKDDGAQVVMTRKEFEQAYGWKNDPAKVRLLDAAASAGDPDATKPTQTTADSAKAKPAKSILSGPEWKPQPLSLKSGEPVAPGALVTQPAKVPGVLSWNVTTRSPRGVRNVLPSPDGTRWAIEDINGTVFIADRDQPDVRKTLLGGDRVGAWSWSPNGRYFVAGFMSAKADHIAAWDATAARQVFHQERIPSRGPLTLGVSPDGEKVAFWHSDAEGNGDLEIWNMVRSTRLVKREIIGGLNSVNSLDWIDNESLFAAHSVRSELIRVGIDGTTSRPIGAHDHFSFARIVGTHLILEGQNQLRKYELPEWTRAGESPITAGFSRFCAADPAGTRILVAHHERALTIEVRTSDLTVLNTHPGINYLFDAEGELLQWRVADSDLILRNVSTGAETKLCAVASESAGPVSWDAKASAQAWAPAADFNTYRFSWSADRRWFVEATHGMVQVWDAPAGKIVRTLKSAEPLVRATIDPAGKLVAAADEAGRLVSWTIDGEAVGEFPTTIGPKSALVFSPDGQMLLAGGKGVEIFDVETLVKADNYDGELATPGRSLAFLEDRKQLAIRGRDKLRVIDLAQQKPVREIELAGVSGAFFGDDRYCVARDQAGVTRIAELATGRVESVLHLAGGHWLAISPEGHYRGSAGIEEHLAFTAVLESGEHRLLSPEEFATAHGWKNDPTQVHASRAAPPADTASWGQPPKPESFDLPVIKPELKAGTPLTERALVAKPAKVAGVASWTVETREPRTHTDTILEHPGGKGFVTLDGTGMLRLWKTLTGDLQSIAAPGSAVYTRGHISPDGRYTACVDLDGTVHVVDNRIKCRVWEFTAHQPTLYSMGCAWSPEGAMLATGGSDRKICLWDIKTRVLIDVIEPPDMVGQLQWSPDGLYLAAGRSDTHHRGVDGFDLYEPSWVSVWDSQQRTCIAAFKGSERTLSIDWTPDGQNLIASFDDSSPDLAVWDRSSGTVALRKRPASYSYHALSPDGAELALFKARSTSIERFSFLDFSPIGKLKSIVDLHKFAWLPRSNQIVATSADGTLLLWKPSATEPRVVRKGAAHKSVLHHNGQILRWSSNWKRPVGSGGNVFSTIYDRLSYSADGQNILRYYGASTPKEIPILSRETGKEHVLRGHAGGIDEAVLSPDGTRAVTASHLDHTGRIWDVEKEQEIGRIDELIQGGVQALAWSPANDLIAVSVDGGNSKFFVCDGRTGNKLYDVAYRNCVDSLCFSPRGDRLAGLHTRDLMIVDSATGKLLHTHPAPCSFNAPFLWLADRSAIAYLGSDGRVHVVDPDTGKDLRTIGSGIGNGVFNWDGSLFVSYDPGSQVRVFSTATGELEYTLLYLRDDHWLALSPDGHYAGSPGVEELLVYVAMLDDGSQVTLTPAEFAKKYDWKNDPKELKLLDEKP